MNIFSRAGIFSEQWSLIHRLRSCIDEKLSRGIKLWANRRSWWEQPKTVFKLKQIFTLDSLLPGLEPTNAELHSWLGQPSVHLKLSRLEAPSLVHLVPLLLTTKCFAYDLMHIAKLHPPPVRLFSARLAWLKRKLPDWNVPNVSNKKNLCLLFLNVASLLHSFFHLSNTYQLQVTTSPWVTRVEHRLYLKLMLDG